MAPAAHRSAAADAAVRPSHSSLDGGIGRSPRRAMSIVGAAPNTRASRSAALRHSALPLHSALRTDSHSAPRTPHVALLRDSIHSLDTLRRWGVKTFGALAALPPGDVYERLGRARRVLAAPRARRGHDAAGALGAGRSVRRRARSRMADRRARAVVVRAGPTARAAGRTARARGSRRGRPAHASAAGRRRTCMRARCSCRRRCAIRKRCAR